MRLVPACLFTPRTLLDVYNKWAGEKLLSFFYRWGNWAPWMSHFSLSHPGLTPFQLVTWCSFHSLFGKPGGSPHKDFAIIGWLNEKDITGSSDYILYFLTGKSKAQIACWSPRLQESRAPGVPSSTHTISWVPSSPGSRAPQSPISISWAPSPHPEQAGLWRSASLTYIYL